jgi:hypothetical protein
MLQNVFHGILVDAAFRDRSFPENFPIFARQKSNDWILYGIEVPIEKVEEAITLIQANMRSDEEFYSHLYDDETVIAIFKNRIFRMTPHSSSWDEVREYGLTLQIPPEQLDFWPNRFQDEIHYFRPENFLEAKS